MAGAATSTCLPVNRLARCPFSWNRSVRWQLSGSDEIDAVLTGCRPVVIQSPILLTRLLDRILKVSDELISFIGGDQISFPIGRYQNTF